MSNARRHRRKKLIFNLDLENFFPSLNFGRVRGYFMKNKDFMLSPRVATVIAQIACFEGILPQGSPCSPVIANLIANALDIRLLSLASAAGCAYSRYAYDLTFSTNKKVMPLRIASPLGIDGDDIHTWVPSRDLSSIIERSGFQINDAKTHLMYRRSRQVVTGLVVNETVSVRREYRHLVRAMVYRLVTTGAFDIPKVVKLDKKTMAQSRPGMNSELQGMLGFVDAVRESRKKGLEKHRSVKVRDLSADERAHRQFLFYSNFFAAQEPVILAEGGTDNVYLTHAIRMLAADFTELAEVSESQKIRLKVRLFKYARSSTARLVNLHDGGVGDLAKLIGCYLSETRNFHRVASICPVIIVFDNDQGSKPILNAISEVTKVKSPSAVPFFHVGQNLYAVSIPDPSSDMESLFDEKTKLLPIGDKTFEPGKDFDEELNFGKQVFAHKIVRSNESTINFSGFRPLLENISAAINDFGATRSRSART